MINRLYVYTYVDRTALFGVTNPTEDFIPVTLAEAFKIEPDFILHAQEGEILVFSDMTIEIKDNDKALLKD